jgi:hypothetical protein
MIRIFAAALALALIAGAACAQLDPQNMPAPILPLTGTEIIPCDQNNGYKKCTASMLFNQQTVAPNQLKFGPPTPLPYFDPQPSGLIDVTDNFASTGTFTQTNQSGTPSFSVAGNVGTISTSGVAAALWSETSDATLLAPEFFNAVTVTAQTPASGYSDLFVGSCKDGANYVGMAYRAANNAIYYEYDVAGTIYFASLKGITLTPPYTIGAALMGNGLSAWYKSGTGPWQYAGEVQTNSNIDYTVTANFASAGYKTCFGLSNGAAGSFHVSTLQGGREGGVTMRDIKPVVNNDWTTYQPGNNTIDFTATIEDPNPGTNQGGAGVFTLNLNTQVITQTGVICVARSHSGTAHTYCGDDGINIIYHANGDREILLCSWSDDGGVSTPVHIEYEYVTNGSQSDLLTTNLSVLSSVATPNLPLSGNLASYDGALAYDSAHSRYLMAYTVAPSSGTTNFWPAMAYASSPTGTWTLIGMDTGLGNTGWEGTSWVNVSGTLYEVTGGPRYPISPAFQACTQARIYDETFTFKGSFLGATFSNMPYAGGNFCSHPTLFQDPDGIHQVLLTFLSGQFNSGNIFTIGQPVIEISTP